MPKISEQELARLVKEAEWKGQIVTTIATIADQAVTARNEAAVLKKDCEDGIKRLGALEGKQEQTDEALGRMSSRINTILEQEGNRKMSGADKAKMYGSLIAAISAMVIAALQYLLH